jgi:Protein of unknown function (DUF3108)
MIVNLRLRPAAALALSLLLVALPSGASLAGSRIEVTYAVTYLHVTIGSGRWSLDVSGNHYATTASGEVKGMMSLLINGEGSGRADGVVGRSNLLPSRFAAHVLSTAENDDIEVAFQNGAVKELYATPPFPPIPKRVNVSAAALVGVSDPLSAALAFMGGTNDAGPNLCDRRLRIFDGRRRFDVALSFKRTKNVTVPPAFHGTGIICSVQLLPIAGQQVENSALKYLVESKDLEIEYALIPEAHACVPIAATLPTLIGTVHVDATGLTIANADMND